MTTDNVKPDSQLRFHGQAQHSLQSSRTTSEFAIKWSQAEHCTLPPVSASALMLPMLLSIHSFLQLTDAQQGRAWELSIPLLWLRSHHRDDNVHTGIKINQGAIKN